MVQEVFGNRMPSGNLRMTQTAGGDYVLCLPYSPTFNLSLPNEHKIKAVYSKEPLSLATAACSRVGN